MENRLTKILSAFNAEPDSKMGSPATLDEIASVESVLGIALPTSYKWFLEYTGAANWPDYIYGAGNGVPLPFTVISLTQRERTLTFPPIPFELIPFSGDGRGNHYCLATSKMAEGECPIAFWDHDMGPNQEMEIVNSNFLEWLEQMIAERIEIDKD